MSIPLPKPASYQRREREKEEQQRRQEGRSQTASSNNNSSSSSLSPLVGGGANGKGRPSPKVSPTLPPAAGSSIRSNGSSPPPLPSSGTGTPLTGPAPPYQEPSGMTFTSYGGGGHQRRVSGSGTSPMINAKIPSPQLNPAPRSSSGGSPPIAPKSPPPPNTGTFRPPAPFSLGESAVSSIPGAQDKTGRRIDATKFKTETFRNYSETGNWKGGAAQLSPQLYVNHLAEILLAEVNKEVQSHTDTQETNRQLETSLREEQNARQKLLRELATVEKELEEVRAASLEKDKTLQGLKRQLKVAGPPILGPTTSSGGSHILGGAATDSSSYQEPSEAFFVGGVLNSPSK